jgi:hypothetical protein
VENPEFKSALQNKILQQKNVVDGIPEKPRLEVRDRKLFTEAVIIGGGTNTERKAEGLDEPEGRYVNAINIFRAKLAGLSQKELEALITFLNQKCVVIYLATPTFDDAFRLFTVVNDRGQQLRRIDILKAINIAPAVITSETVRSRVAQQWEQLEKDLGGDTFENVFHLVRLILLNDKPQGDLLNEFEKRIFPKNTVSKGEPFFTLIFDYARLYSSIFTDRDFLPEEAKDRNKCIALVHIMDDEFRASEWRACLLYFAKRFAQESFYEFVLALEKIYLIQWVNGVRKDERYAEYAKLLGLIESAKKGKDVVKEMKFDPDAIAVAISGLDIYHAGYGKYFLLRLELATAEHDRINLFTAKSIEHVLPQNPDTTGYWAGKHDLSQIKDYVNHIGNLVLLSKSKNSSAQNFDFPKKKEKYLKTRVSDYPRSVQVLDYTDWEKTTIEKRTEEAKKLILDAP